jgi:hypothetical protein
MRARISGVATVVLAESGMAGMGDGSWSGDVIPCAVVANAVQTASNENNLRITGGVFRTDAKYSSSQC